MSFTTTVKNEITKLDFPKSESMAMLAAIIRTNSDYSLNNLTLTTENVSIARKIYQLFKELYEVSVDITTRQNVNFSKHSLYIISLNEKINFILKDLSIIDEGNNYLEKPEDYLIGSEEEIRAYLRGSFLMTGSINDPKTSRYHLELSISRPNDAVLIQKLLNGFDLNAKLLTRDKGYMIYIKEAEKISDFLRIISANSAVLYFEDIRIYRDHKNMTNRLNNCEQANIDKTIATANEQIAQITLLVETLGEDILDEKTKEAVNYRLKYPEASLQELSEIISIETGKPITKSGLNHRFRKIKELVKNLKKET